MGGGIAVSFAAYYSYLVNSIILLAPGGIIRNLPEAYGNPLFHFRRLVPSGYLRRLVGNIVGVSLRPTPVEDLTNRNVKNHTSLDMASITQWQFDYHKGFVYSFVDTVLHGPLMNQHSDWRRLCDIIKGSRSELAIRSQRNSPLNGKIVVIFGEDDNVVVGKEVSADLVQMLGDPKHIDIRLTPGGHGFPIPSSGNVVEHICRFMDLPTVTL